MTVKQEWLDCAVEALAHAYVPYSNFPVGACLVTTDGKMYQGVNIENASFGLTNCAERTAIFKAISEGDKDIYKIAIASDNSENNEQTYPCGICRQVIIEFGSDIKIITGYTKGEVFEHSIKDLLPNYFSGNDLK